MASPDCFHAICLSIHQHLFQMPFSACAPIIATNCPTKYPVPNALPTHVSTIASLFPPQHDDREILFENKAIELLDMASKILASANYNSLTHHRGLNPAGSKEMAASDATFEEKNEAMGSQLLPDQHNTQVGAYRRIKVHTYAYRCVQETDAYRRILQVVDILTVHCLR